MPDQSFTFDSQVQWETGKMESVHALEPAGKLSLGFDTNSVAGLVEDGALAVYCRCRTGSGTTIENVGLAGSGVFSGGAWGSTIDGRSYLVGGQVTISFHASMGIADINNDKHNQSGGLMLRLSSHTAQVFMERENRIRLGLLSTGFPYVECLVGATWHRATSSQSLPLSKWSALSFVMNGGSLALLLDGTMVARTSGIGTKADPSTNLTVSCTGDWDHFYLFGDGTNGDSILRQASSGRWTRVETSASRMTLRYAEFWVAKKETEHSLSFRLRFADAESELPYTESWSFTLKDGYNKITPPSRGLLHGTNMELTLALSSMDWHRELPLIDKITVHTREPAPPLLAAFEEGGVGFQPIERQEVSAPEDLSSSLKEIRRLQANIIKIEERQRSLSDFAGSWGSRKRNVIEEARELTFDEVLRQVQAEHWLPSAARNRAIYNRTIMFEAQVKTHMAASFGVHGVGASTIASQADIATHAAATTGVHGVGASHVESQVRLNIHANRVNTHGVTHIAGVTEDLTPHIAAITGVHGVGASTVASLATVVDRVSAHNLLTGNVHGVPDAEVVVGSGPFFDHVLAVSNVHGVGTSTIASQANIATHAAATTGVHGIDLGLGHIAKSDFAPALAATVEAQITAHAVDTTTHGVGASVIASLEDISNHNLLTGNVHGVPAVEVVVGSGSFFDHVLAVSNVHGVGSSPIASQQYVNSRITDHQGRCRNYAL